MKREVVKLIKLRDKVLKAFAGSLEGYYLAGGTALSEFYFRHRESVDLDFFTKEYSGAGIDRLLTAAETKLPGRFELKSELAVGGKAKMRVYYFETVKVDFVEDLFELVGSPAVRTVDGVPVLALEDIYLRKIFTACGSAPEPDVTGRTVFRGGRQEAKDFFDLYRLSSTFIPLSDFVFRYGGAALRESVVVWFRSYNRLQVKSGLSEIMTAHQPDFREMEKHFKREVERIVRRGLV